MLRSHWLFLCSMLCLVAAPSASSLTAAEDAVDPRRPAAITTDGVPAVPEPLFERLRQYQNTRAAAFAGWDPSGEGILIQTRFANAAQLHRVYQSGGRREQITFFEEPVEGRFIPKATDGAILMSMSQGGSEDDQVYLLDRQAYRTTLLTDGKSRHGLGPIRRDGAQMIVTSNRRNGRDTDLLIADCRKPDSMQPILKANGEFWTAADWSHDGARLLLNRYVSINESYPALFDLADKKLQPLPIPGGKAAFGSLAFSADDHFAYLTSDAQGEFLQLARLDLKTLEYNWLTEDLPWDVDEQVVDQVGGRVAFTINEDGASKLYLLEGDERRALDLPLGIVLGLDFSADGKQLGFTLARPDSPADAYSVRVADGKLTRWTHSEAGGLNPETFIAPQRIKFPTFDQRMIPTYYFRPRTASAEKPAAVLIQIHGGPEGQYRPLFSGITQFYLNELGIAVLAPNVRGSSGYGKTYLTLDNATLREDSVRDIGGLLDWIAQQPELDSSRVAVTGGSYGGYMVLASLVHFGDRIRAGIDHVGIANFLTFLEKTSAYRQDLRRAEYGDERNAEIRSFFERINPSAHADKIRSALLVAHGRNDPRVPFFEAQQIAEKVRSAGRPVWTVYADNEGHGFAKKDNRDYTTAVEVMFLKQHLGLDGAGKSAE